MSTMSDDLLKKIAECMKLRHSLREDLRRLALVCANPRASQQERDHAYLKLEDTAVALAREVNKYKRLRKAREGSTLKRGTH